MKQLNLQHSQSMHRCDLLIKRSIYKPSYAVRLCPRKKANKTTSTYPLGFSMILYFCFDLTSLGTTSNIIRKNQIDPFIVSSLRTYAIPCSSDQSKSYRCKIRSPFFSAWNLELIVCFDAPSRSLSQQKNVLIRYQNINSKILHTAPFYMEPIHLLFNQSAKSTLKDEQICEQSI